MNSGTCPLPYVYRARPWARAWSAAEAAWTRREAGEPAARLGAAPSNRRERRGRQMHFRRILRHERQALRRTYARLFGRNTRASTTLPRESTEARNARRATILAGQQEVA